MAVKIKMTEAPRERTATKRAPSTSNVPFYVGLCLLFAAAVWWIGGVADAMPFGWERAVMRWSLLAAWAIHALAGWLAANRIFKDMEREPEE